MIKVKVKNIKRSFHQIGLLLILVLLSAGCSLTKQQSSYHNSPPGGDLDENNIFELKDPDYEISPHTGMTKKHWRDAALFLLNGAFTYIKDLDDPMKFPKLPGKSYPHNESRVPTEKLEGLCRTLFLAAPLLKENPSLEINSIKVADYYRHQILTLVDPKNPAYIDPRSKDGEPSQNLVEFGALAISLFVAPEVIWDPLAQEDKDALAKTMLSYGDGPTVPSNWKFFNIFVLSFFDAQGYEVNQSLLQEYLEKSLDDYRGQGWYNDNPAYDYYSMWAYQMYGMLWSEFYGNEKYPEYAARFRENFSDLQGNYPYIFSEEGEMIMWGRSISYRMGAIVPFPLMGFMHDSHVNHGWHRRISSGTILQFLQHPDFLKDNVPTLGFYGHFEPAVQEYSARGSVYWMGKAFLGLLVPDDNPFWIATENEGSWDNDFSNDEVYNHFQEASNILITNYPAIGASEIRAWCHERKADDWQNFRSGENYNRLSYNSAFHWQADGENGEVAMNYVFKNNKNEWEPLRLYTFKRFEDGVYYRDVVLETNENVTMNLAEIPLHNGILRIDRNTSAETVDMRLGNYALPKIKGNIKEEVRIVDNYKIHIIDNGEYQLAMVPLLGWDNMETLETSGLHPVDEISKVTNIMAKYSPNKENPGIFATLMLWKKSGRNWTNDELIPISTMNQNENGQVRVIMKDGHTQVVNFE